MRRVRRRNEEPRIEMFPLIDVVFLLLTFFMFALVVMVQLDVTRVSLPETRVGEHVQQGKAITLSIDAEGRTYVDDQELSLQNIVGRIDEIRAESPDARLFIAADRDVGFGRVTQIVDILTAAGIRDLQFLREPGQRNAPSNP